jgi:hypothetical protein
MGAFGKSELEKTIEHLTCVNHQVIYQTGFGAYFIIVMAILLIYCMSLKLQHNMLVKM